MDYREVNASPVTYVKAKDLKKGDIIEGIYRGSYEDQYEKLNFRIVQSDGSTKILNGTALLEQKFQSIEDGTPVKVVYEGTNKLTKGKYAGKEAHSFKVLIGNAASTANAQASNVKALPF